MHARSLARSSLSCAALPAPPPLPLLPYPAASCPLAACRPAPGEPPEGERKLYLLIEAPTEAKVRAAKQEIRRAIEEHVEKAMRRDTGMGGRYQIV